MDKRPESVRYSCGCVWDMINKPRTPRRIIDADRAWAAGRACPDCRLALAQARADAITPAGLAAARQQYG